MKNNDFYEHTKVVFNKEFRIVALIAIVLIIGAKVVTSNSLSISFFNSRASAPCDSYTSSNACTGAKCEWYGNPATCHVASCGGLLNMLGRNDPAKYTGGCYPNGAPSGEGWVSAGYPSQCDGAVMGCFYKQINTVASNVNPVVTNLDSCGGTLVKLGKGDTSKYDGQCFPNGAPANQGWTYAGQTNDCGSSAGNTSRGCFYRPVDTTVPGPTSTPKTLTQSSTSTIVVRAKGTPVQGVYPRMELWDGTKMLQAWFVTGSYARYTYVGPTSGALLVKFTNDAYETFGAWDDRNLTVDYLTVNSQTIQAESSDVYAVGVWDGSSCAGRYARSETLSCNGYFQFTAGQSNTTPADWMAPMPTRTPTQTPTTTPSATPTTTPSSTPVVSNSATSKYDLNGTVGTDTQNAPNSAGTKLSIYFDIWYQEMNETIFKEITKKYGPIYVDFYLDGQFMARSKIEQVYYYGYMNRAAYRAFVSWTEQFGTHTITGVIDPTNTIPESNESNNSSSKTWVVK